MRFAIRILFVAGLLAILLGPGASTAWSRQVQISYTAKVVTAAGTPFGLANLQGKTMTGYFYYDTSTTDSLPFDSSRGNYNHSLSFNGFYGVLDGTNFAGSKTPTAIVENISTIDTFRFLDGLDSAKPGRALTVNGVVLPTAQLTFAISSDKNPLNADYLPDPFPFTAANAHTFSLSDKNGTLLLQFQTLTDASPAPPGLVSVKISVTDKRARFIVDGGAYTGSKTFQWPALSTHQVEFPIEDDGRQYNQQRNSRWGFGGWSEISGLLEIPRDYSVTLIANPGVELSGTVGGFQHRLQMNFFGNVVDLQNSTEVQANAPGCGTAGLQNPPSLRSGVVYLDGACYWQSFSTWVSEASHTFNAFPYPGFAFMGWLGGETNMTSQFRTLNITGPTVLETRFTPARRVRILTDPLGLRVKVDDVEIIPAPDKCPPLAVPTPATIKPPCIGEFDFAPGSAHILSVPTPQSDSFSKSWVFDGFSNGMGNNASYTVGAVTFNDNYDTIFARFVPGVSSVISSKPFGVPIGINGADSASQYMVFRPGDQVKLSAPLVASANGRKYKFLRWSNGGDREQMATIPLDAGDYFNLFAEYSADSQILIDSATPNASVLVNGQVCPLPCPVDGDPGQEIRIEPNPAGSTSPLQKIEFVRWTDGATPARIETLEGEESRRLIAEFHNSYLLQLGTEPGNGATFETTPASADNFFPEGTAVAITAKPKGGFTFNRWSGDALGAQPATQLTLDRSKTARAELDRVPYLAENPVRNAATGVAGAVAAGSVVSIVGESLAYEFVEGPDNPLSQAIYGTSAAVDYYRFLPLKFVSPQQINAVLPADLTPGQHTISVRRSGYEDVIGTFTVTTVAPGIFQSTDDTRVTLGYRSDGSLIGPGNPARPGEEVTVLGTGFGAYQLTPVDGTPLPLAPPYALASPVEIFLGDQKVDSANGYGQPGQTGVTEIHFRIPQNVTSSTVDLKARIQGEESPVAPLPVGLTQPGAAATTAEPRPAAIPPTVVPTDFQRKKPATE